MTDLGDLNYFIGIVVTCDKSDMFLSQRQYVLEILERAHMLNCKISRTHTDTSSKLNPAGPLVLDPTLYQSLLGSLQYLTFTHHDIAYAVHQIYLYMHDPCEPTPDYGLQLYASPTPDLVAYFDADWAGCLSTR